MDEDYTIERPSGPITWRALGAIALAGASGIFEEIAATVEGFSTALIASHNHAVEQRHFREQAALEIETLTRGLEP